MFPEIFNNPERVKQYALEHDLQLDDKGRLIKGLNGDFIKNPGPITLDDLRTAHENLKAETLRTAQEILNAETSVDNSISPTSSAGSPTGSITPTNNKNTVAVDYKDPWAHERSRTPETQAEFENYFAKPEDIKGKSKVK